MTTHSAPQGYDLIGDIHGCAMTLRLLLVRLGYSRRNGVYSHPRRKAIFLGDIIDRGPRIREALHLVRDMVEAGHALIVMGNHEYNYLCYTTPGEVDNPPYLREHTPRHQRILQQTIDQLANYPADRHDFYQWMLNLPIFLEKDDFRVVHACWYQPLIDAMRERHGGAYIDAGFLQRSARHGSFEWSVMDRLLRGTHLELPNGELMVSRDGFKRRFFRTKFWLEQPEKYIDVVFQPDPLPEHIAIRDITSADRRDLYNYDASQKPLFIGHYWCEGQPQPITDNIACIDYSAVKYGKLVAYRYDGEAQLCHSKFTWVDVRTEIGDQR